MGVMSLVLSITSLFIGVNAIGGVIFGHMSVKAVKRGEASNLKAARAGLVMGYIVLGFGFVGFVLLFLLIALIKAMVEGVTY